MRAKYFVIVAYCRIYHLLNGSMLTVNKLLNDFEVFLLRTVMNL